MQPQQPPRAAVAGPARVGARGRDLPSRGAAPGARGGGRGRPRRGGRGRAPGRAHAGGARSPGRPSLAQGVRVRRVHEDVLASLSEVETSQGLLAIAERPRFEDARLFAGVPLVVVAIDVQNPGNLGGLLRTAEAAGATGALLVGATADAFSWKALRGSMGSAFRLPHLRERSLEAALDRLEAQRPARSPPPWPAAARPTTGPTCGAAGPAPGQRGQRASPRQRRRAPRSGSRFPSPRPWRASTWAWRRASCSSKPPANGALDPEARHTVSLQ